MNDSDWLPIKTAPKDGTYIICLWPSYNQKVAFHEGVCVWKRDYYQLGNIEWEGWWIVGGGPPSKEPECWRGVAPR
jgi:hypothetical protein